MQRSKYHKYTHMLSNTDLHLRLFSLAEPVRAWTETIDRNLAWISKSNSLTITTTSNIGIYKSAQCSRNQMHLYVILVNHDARIFFLHEEIETSVNMGPSAVGVVIEPHRQI